MTPSHLFLADLTRNIILLALLVQCPKGSILLFYRASKDPKLFLKWKKSTHGTVLSGSLQNDDVITERIKSHSGGTDFLMLTDTLNL